MARIKVTYIYSVEEHIVSKNMEFIKWPILGSEDQKFKAVWTIKDLFNSSDKALISSRIQFLIYKE